MIELWKNIDGYEGLYQVSNRGEVRSLDRLDDCNGRYKRQRKGRLLKPMINDKTGYIQFALCKNNNYKYPLAHRLVAQAFLENQYNYKEVNHIDGNKKNNDVDNLEWASRELNMLHAKGNNLTLRGESNNNVKLTNEQALEVYNLSWFGKYKLREISEMYNISISAINHIKHGRSFGWLTKHNKD